MPLCLSSNRPVRRSLARFALICALFSLGTGSSSAQSAPARPLTIPELTLLLHGGYTGDEVLRETAGRPLLAPLDDASEKTLRAAGADQHLIDILKTSRRALSDSEADAARQRQAELDARDTQGRADYASRLMEANHQALIAHQIVRKQEALGTLAAQLNGKLVTFRDGQLRPCTDNAQTQKKLFAFYFSASWCAPCRQFTPKLVQFYQDFAPKHPAFEVVLISEDKTADDMENYMRQDAMPWPALAYDLRASQPGLLKLAEGGGIPRLVLVDGEGRLVSDSYDASGKYVGPQHVLDDLAKLAKAGGG